jgi:hypothetical protein
MTAEATEKPAAQSASPCFAVKPGWLSPAVLNATESQSQIGAWVVGA